VANGLPITTIEEQLRQLIDTCPSFDVEQVKKLDDWWQPNPMATGFPKINHRTYRATRAVRIPLSWT